MKKLLSMLLVSALLLTCGMALAQDNNFAEQCQTYLEYIGTTLTDRNSTAVGETPEEGNTHEETVAWILSELKNAGYTDEQIAADVAEFVSPYSGKTYPVQNIVLTVEGKDTSRQVVAGAHYDGDGVGDNGSGLALLLGAATGLAGQQPLYTVKYVFFDAEEVGLVGASMYAAGMTEEEVANTVYMINIDSIAFGDYTNIYGGVQDDEAQTVTQTEGYDLAVEKAKALGMNVMTTAELDGYYAANGEGPAIEANTLYTNPWTYANPAPINGDYASPATGDWSDHADYKYLGIPYIYFEATNWYAEGDGGEDAYTGYFETTDTSLGYDGMFMNTEFDTLENLNSFFPGRSLEHFKVFSPLLSSLILNPAGAEATAE